MDGEKILQVKEAAEYLRVSESLVRRLCSEKQIPLHKIGARVVFFATELEQWVKSDGEMPDGTSKKIGIRRVRKVNDRKRP